MSESWEVKRLRPRAANVEEVAFGGLVL